MSIFSLKSMGIQESSVQGWGGKGGRHRIIAYPKKKKKSLWMAGRGYSRCRGAVGARDDGIFHQNDAAHDKK